MTICSLLVYFQHHKKSLSQDLLIQTKFGMSYTLGRRNFPPMPYLSLDQLKWLVPDILDLWLPWDSWCALFYLAEVFWHASRSELLKKFSLAHSLTTNKLSLQTKISHSKLFLFLGYWEWETKVILILKFLKNLSRQPLYARIFNKEVNWKHQKVKIWAKCE